MYNFKYFIAIILCLTSLYGFSRLGETEEQLQERFGLASKPGTSNLNPHGEMRGYKKSGISIRVELVNGKCELISYKSERGRLAPDEVEKLLKVNGASWSRMKPKKLFSYWVMTPAKMWKSDDGKIIAYSFGNDLSLISQNYSKFVKAELAKKEQAKKAAEEANKTRLEGF